MPIVEKWEHTNRKIEIKTIEKNKPTYTENP